MTINKNAYIYGGIGFAGISVLSYFFYKKYIYDDDEDELNRIIREKEMGFGSAGYLSGGKKSKNKNKNRKSKNRKTKKQTKK